MGENAATVFTFLGQLVTNTITWLGDLLTFITSQPVILIPMLVFFISGGVIGLLTRLWRS